MTRSLPLALAAIVVCSLVAPRAEAVPAFARRYGTSCQTCHVAYPKNTPFGEAFRRLGYHFPGGDEDVRRDEPQKLGADANKDLFPDAVWPGELPTDPPLSMTLASNVAFTSSNGAGVSFGNVGGAIGLNAAAPLGERISAWVGLTVMGSTGEEAMVAIERAFVTISTFDKPWANVRIGRFEPGVLSFSMHRTLGLVPWFLTSRVGDNPSTLEPTQLGGEVTGVLPGGRFTYAAGLVEGGGRVNLPKDAYARVGYKLGGLRLDGETDDEENAANPAPWREWSVQVGAFGYLGHTALGSPGGATQDDRSTTFGGDVNALLGDANVILAYSMSQHARPRLSNPVAAVDASQLLAQLDYVVWPWLVPSVRFERRTFAAASEDRASAAVYALARANVRVLLLASVAREGSGSFGFDGGQAGLSVGF